MEQDHEVKAPKQVEGDKALAVEVEVVDFQQDPADAVFAQAAARKLPTNLVCHVMSKNVLNVEHL
jgi:hypothetical protein